MSSFLTRHSTGAARLLPPIGILCSGLAVLAGSLGAAAQELRNRTIVYAMSGPVGGRFSIYIAPGGSIYETNISGASGLSGIHYRIGRTMTETNNYTGTMGDRFSCNVRSTAALARTVLTLTAHYRCTWGRGSILNGDFDRQTTVTLDGSSCRVQSSQRKVGAGIPVSQTSDSCSIVAGNQLGPVR
jgi:hypothetical protein